MKKKRGGKDTEHYFCARNITNSYFLEKKHSGRFRVIQGRVETQCVFYFFVKYANFLFLFPDVCCLTFYLQQWGQQFVQIQELKKHFCWSDVSSHCNRGEANRLKLLLPVTAAQTIITLFIVYSQILLF